MHSATGLKPDGSPAPVHRKNTFDISVLSFCYMLWKNQICTTKVQRIKQFWAFRHFLKNLAGVRLAWSGFLPQTHQAHRSGVRHMYFNENRIGAARPVNRPLKLHAAIPFVRENSWKWVGTFIPYRLTACWNKTKIRGSVFGVGDAKVTYFNMGVYGEHCKNCTFCFIAQNCAIDLNRKT